MRVLSADDLVPDEPLGSVGSGRIGEGEDLLHHRVLARRVAELAVSSEGKVNIALFGPWGSGKSSFNALLGEELRAQTPKTQHITFDAWKNAGSDFRTNFLYALAEQVKADVKLSEQLFQSSTSVAVPVLKRLGVGAKPWQVGITVAVFLLAVFVGLPALWTSAQLALGSTRNYLALLVENAAGFASVAAGGTLLLIVALALLDLSKVTVSRSTPSHVAQFGSIFQKILSTKKNTRFVIFIDELDRCTATDVMTTLEGLRTFLGDPRCVFVVAFDREAVAATIAKEITHKVPTEGVAPYYRTSGEYLDKIFQFQLALPPQPVHTFRRFANSLVQERGGVWAQLRDHDTVALERIVSILSPMHLASPRRTKVLLNDFAVNARVYEGMGFDWLERAEEVAVLTVLQTEFPRLAADLEREPALMRFLYRDEEPARRTLIELVHKYSDNAKAAAPLDQIVGKDTESEVAKELQGNLQRYFRRLRELHVPEPRADLIMMHSDGALLSFDDPGVFHELLSAADSPREDVRAALATASSGDNDRAIRYLLEQTERESSSVAHGLLVLVGEIAAAADDVDPSLARLMSGRVGGSTFSFGTLSLTGYATAAAVAYSKAEITAVLAVAKQDDNADVPTVISRTIAVLEDGDWADVRRTLLSELVLYVPDGAAAVTSDALMRFAQDVNAELPGYVVSNLALALSADKPETVEPESTTTTARAAANERNAELQEAFEAERDRLRIVAEEVTDCWVELPATSSVRNGLLTALRGADNGSGYLDVHDALIERDIERGLLDEANDLLLAAIAQEPLHAMSRWSGKLTTVGAAEARRKQTALERVVGMLTTTTHEQIRDNAAIAAERIAAVPSDPVDITDLFNEVRLDLRAPWEEYSDSRFETQLRLLRVVASLAGDEDPTAQERADLYVMSTKMAQAEGVDVVVLSQSLAGETGQFAGMVADRMNTDRLWEDDNPEQVLAVTLAGHDRALDTGVEIVALPAEALTQVTDADTRRRLAPLWLATAPAVSEVENLADAHALPASSWKVFGTRSTGENRAQAWNFLTRKQASMPVLQAVSAAGQPMEVYADVAASVRDADVVRARERAVDRFLALPAVRASADHARTVIKVMAQDAKRTELILGVRILRAYTPLFTESTIRSLRPFVSEWAKVGEGYVAKRDISWLITHGYVTKKSGLLELFKALGTR